MQSANVRVDEPFAKTDEWMLLKDFVQQNAFDQPELMRRGPIPELSINSPKRGAISKLNPKRVLLPQDLFPYKSIANPAKTPVRTNPNP